MQNIETKSQEKSSLKGVYKFTKAFIETDEQRALDSEIRIRQAMGLPVIDMIRKLNEICRVEVTEVENLIPTVGRAAIASWLTNPSPSPASILLNYTALGTGVTAPANADTQLGTETYRKLIASETNSNNIAYATAFYTAAECSGTYTEAGIFMNGTATANSGTLFSHVTVSIVKTTSTTLTIDYTITLS